MMPAKSMTFPCCASKELKVRIYCCVICHSIVHKSCWERKKNWIHIDQHQIYCSRSCSERAISNEFSVDRLKELQTENVRLRAEIDLKDKHYQDMKTRSAAFEDDVFDMEGYYKKELEEKSKMIKDLQAKLNGIDGSVNQTPTRVQSVSTYTQTSSYFNKDANTQTLSCITSSEAQTEIDDYTIEEAFYLYALTHVHKECSTQTNFADFPDCDSNNNNNNSSQTVPHHEYSFKRKPQLVIIGDSVVKGCAKLFKMGTSAKFDINTQYRPKTSIEELCEIARTYLRKMNRNDFLILFTGPGDSIYGRNINTNILRDFVLRAASKTNVIIVGSAHMHPRRHILNRLISHQNKSIEQVVNAISSAKFVNANEFGLNYSFMNLPGSYVKKNNLVNFICESLILPIALAVEQHEQFMERFRALGATNNSNSNDNPVPIATIITGTLDAANNSNSTHTSVPLTTNEVTHERDNHNGKNAYSGLHGDVMMDGTGGPLLFRERCYTTAM